MRGIGGAVGRSRRAATLLGAALSAGLWAAPASAAGDLYGIVIGIDDYVGTANDLEGAVNDAKDIAQAMKRAGGQVVLLTNALATRAAIERTWFDLVTRAKPGDTLVFSFAGHGSQEPQPPGWHEPNGKSDNFLLGGYTGTGPGARERIVDYEMYQWLKAADDKNVNVVFIADSCHSGTMFRSVGANPPRYRTGKFPDPTLAGDLLKLPDPALANVKEDDFKNVTFVGATQDHMVTPELTIGGEKRGALSWAFSRAIEGAADTNKDGQLSQQEMLAYIIPTVTTQSENQQVPSMLPLRADQRAIMRSVAGSATGPRLPPAPVAQAPNGALLKFFAAGGAPAGLPAIPGLALAASPDDADLIWDRRTGTVDHRVGGRVAEGVTERNLSGVLSKWATLAFVKAATAASPVNFQLASGNQTYTLGTTVQIVMSGAQYPYLTLFSLPPDGSVDFFLPGKPDDLKVDWRTRPFSEQFKVDHPPYGAEHLVAILTEKPVPALAEALRQMKTPERGAGLAAILVQTLAGVPFQAGVVGIYTSGG
ncbi:MAG: caspase family protein [Bauldia sp.]